MASAHREPSQRNEELPFSLGVAELHLEYEGAQNLWRRVQTASFIPSQRKTAHMTDIESLLGAMTLEEKIGQLTMASAGFAITGPVLAEADTEAVRAGQVGSLLNIFGAEAAHRIQRVAVEESRLGIPLLLGFDILHGHRTIFPIPLAEAATFDPVLWEQTAREAAAEAARTASP